MPQLTIIVSEIEAAERLEELIGLALEGQKVMVEADNGRLIMLEPMSDDEAAYASSLTDNDMTIHYEPEQNRFRMPTDAGDAVIDCVWQGDVMVLPHAEVPSALRGTGAGARLAHGVFERIEAMGVTARLTCPFFVRVASSEPRWRELFDL